MIGLFLLELLKLLGVFAVVIVIGFLLILKDEYRHQKSGLNMYEQFDKTMAELQRDIRMNMPYGTAKMSKSGYIIFE